MKQSFTAQLQNNGIKITVDKHSNVDYISNKALDNVINKPGDVK